MCWRSLPAWGVIPATQYADLKGQWSSSRLSDSDMSCKQSWMGVSSCVWCGAHVPSQWILCSIPVVTGGWQRRRVIGPRVTLKRFLAIEEFAEACGGRRVWRVRLRLYYIFTHPPAAALLWGASLQCLFWVLSALSSSWCLGTLLESNRQHLRIIWEEKEKGGFP